MKFLKRIITALIFIPVLLFIAYSEIMEFSLFFSIIISTGAIFEIYKVFNVNRIFYYLLSLIIVIAYNYNIFVQGDFNFIYLILFGVFLFIYEIVLYNDKKRRDLKRFLIIFFSNFYIISFFAYFLFIKKNLLLGSRWALLFFISVWSIDSFAYFIGMTLGREKHRGIFKVSPVKSIEGFLAGLFIPSILIIFFRSYFGLTVIEAFSFMFIFSIIVQFGDLSQSLIKRYANVKDTGSILLGHGGIFDRFDSMIFSVPIYYFLIKLFYYI